MPEGRGRRRLAGAAGGAALGLGLLGLFAGPVRLSAQSDELVGLVADCSAAEPRLDAPCREAVLGFRAAQGLAGLLAAGGSDVPGAASTLGRRIGSSPRLSFHARVGLGRGDVPGLDAEEAPAPSRAVTVPSLQAGAAVGVLQGFSPAPTVGGILALDLLASTGVSFLPDDVFDGAVAHWGVGARLGVLRESFRLPGVSLSLVYRGFQDLEAGRVAAPGLGGATFGLSSTSFRATVGKDLLAAGLLAGFGWDRYASDVTVVARGRASPGGPEVEGVAREPDFTSDRVLFFGGASLNYLVLQVSAEAGWGLGHDDLPDRAGGGYDPGAGTFFLNASLRFIY